MEKIDKLDLSGIKDIDLDEIITRTIDSVRYQDHANVRDLMDDESYEKLIRDTENIEINWPFPQPVKHVDVGLRDFRKERAKFLRKYKPYYDYLFKERRMKFLCNNPGNFVLVAHYRILYNEADKRLQEIVENGKPSFKEQFENEYWAKSRSIIMPLLFRVEDYSEYLRPLPSAVSRLSIDGGVVFLGQEDPEDSLLVAFLMDRMNYLEVIHKDRSGNLVNLSMINRKIDNPGLTYPSNEPNYEKLTYLAEYGETAEIIKKSILKIYGDGVIKGRELYEELLDYYPEDLVNKMVDLLYVHSSDYHL